MAGGAGANVVGTAGTPPAGNQGYPANPYGGGALPFDSTNTTTDADMNRGGSGMGLNSLFSTMQNQMQQPMVPPAPPAPAPINNVTDIYKNVLGRDPDAAGLAYWQGQADKGMSLTDIQNSFKATDEYKNRPQQVQPPQQVQQPQAPQQQGQQGGKAGGFGQPQQQQQQQPSPVFGPQANPGGEQQMDSGTGGDIPMYQANPYQTQNPYQVQNPYQGMLQNSYNQMINPYMQRPSTPYQQQFQQQYNPLSYRPNMTQATANLQNVKPSVYTNELAEAKAKLKEYQDAEEARNSTASDGSSTGAGGG